MNTEKLTLEHLAPYLPYRLTVWHPETENAALIVYGLNIPLNKIINGAGDSTLSISEIKPILRPMSDLYKWVDGTETSYYQQARIETDIDMDSDFSFDIDVEYRGTMRIGLYPVLSAINFLYKYHFDIHGLIEKGLAISIHDIKK